MELAAVRMKPSHHVPTGEGKAPSGKAFPVVGGPHPHTPPSAQVQSRSYVFGCGGASGKAHSRSESDCESFFHEGDGGDKRMMLGLWAGGWEVGFQQTAFFFTDATAW